MKILVDADACPVKNIIIKVAKEYKIPITMFIDTSHILKDDYSTVITVDKGCDSVDFAIINSVEKKDIVITQDYGLASVLLAKHAYVINQKGFMYTNENIDQMLFERHISKELRRQGKRTNRNKPKTKQDDIQFENCLRTLLIDYISIKLGCF